MRVKSYSVTIVTPVWCLEGRLFIISFMLNLPFSVGGGCRMRAGELGGKPSESIWEKLTAACWHAHVNMTMVSRWVNCSTLVRDDGMPWSVSSSRRAKPLLWRSRIQAWISVSCWIQSLLREEENLGKIEHLAGCVLLFADWFLEESENVQVPR